ncbi:glycoside hydrolase family 43 protein [Cellulomonas marina]|uniref:Alpha-N-arabinofuranosidase n=1 Tax=Cellulomonas marina TaxID=988821 RepID=A0A1I0Z9W6_9CELL|nr:glycoside hydrolase family 43 protein [Cellulomonas marina]GIG28999.1 glycoside hydrolase 43 family protein [Cellulomonas marina]SFB22435.1 alpha-N-arabinofuranosidase [Cellulomonas marina]
MTAAPEGAAVSGATAVGGAGVVADPEAWRSATNPVLPGMHPDPSVCRVDGPDGTWFYVVTSTFELVPGLPVHRSRDLVHWEPVGHVLTGALSYDGVGDSGGLYAPTIRHDGARFLVVCTHLGGPDGGSGTFVTTAVDPAGPWTPPVWWEGVDGVDPSLLLDDDGRVWAHGARGARRPAWPDQGEVWVREVDPATLRLHGPEHVVWRGAAVGATWTEGPHLYRHGEHVVLLAAEGGTERHHAVVAARASSPLGPYEACPDNPVLTHRALGPGAAVVNVGHADLVEAPDGSWWALVLASRLVGGADLLGRETFLVPVTWHDGWPVLAPGVGTLVPEPGGPGGVRRQDDGQEDGQDEAWVAVRRLPGAVADLGGGHRGGTVRLRAGAGLEAALPAFVGRRLTSPWARLTLGLPERDAGVPADDEVGLALRLSSRQWVTAGVRDGRLVVTSCRDGVPEAVADVVAGVAVGGGGTVVVALEGARAEVAWSPGGRGAGTEGDGPAGAGATLVPVAALDVRHLSPSHAGGFVGVVYGPYATGTGTHLVGPLHERTPHPAAGRSAG